MNEKVMIDRHRYENVVAQRDDALARLEESEAAARAAGERHAAELADLRDGWEKYLAAAREQHEDRLRADALRAERALDEARAAFAGERDRLVAEARGEADALRSDRNALEARVRQLTADLADLRTLVDAMGGTPLGRKMAAERAYREALGRHESLSMRHEESLAEVHRLRREAESHADPV